MQISLSPISVLLRQPLSIKRSYAGAVQVLLGPQDIQKSIIDHPKKSLDICKTLKLVRVHIWPLKDKKGFTTIANIALNRN
jgi:hypothetical protein